MRGRTMRFYAQHPGELERAIRENDDRELRRHLQPQEDHEAAQEMGLRRDANGWALCSDAPRTSSQQQAEETR